MNTFWFSYCIIPFLTLRLARGTDYLHSNFSTVRSVFERQLEFLVWCSITGLYFFLSIRKLYQIWPSRSNSFPASDPAFSLWNFQKGFQKAGNRSDSGKKSRESLLPAAAAGLLLISAFLPYLPEDLPLLSALHLFTAFTSSVLLYYCLLSLSLRLYFLSPSKGRPALLFLISSISFCLCTWIYSGIINTAMEICLVFTACILIRHLTLLSAE